MVSLSNNTTVQTSGGAGGGLTDDELRATPLPVSGVVSVDNFPGGGGLTDSQLRATPVPVSGNVGVLGTVPVSGTFFQGTQPVSGPLTDAQLRASAVPVSMAGGAGDPSATLAVTATGAAAAAVALSLPAAGAGLFHYITHLQIVKYNSAAVTGTATPILVSSSNLPGFPVWTFQRFGAIGQCGPSDIQPGALTRPLRSAVANTATLISCPATTGVLWRVNVHYYTAA